jgi:hypothetical protein
LVPGTELVPGLLDPEKQKIPVGIIEQKDHAELRIELGVCHLLIS